MGVGKHHEFKISNSSILATVKILIIRFSSIGDIVLTTPVVRCVKEQLDAEVHYLTKRGYGPVLEANPYIDKLHSIDKSIGEVSKVLKAEKFDYIIDLHHNLRTLFLKKTLLRPSKSFQKLNMEKWLLTSLKMDKLPKGVHIVDRYMATVEKIGVKNDNKGLDYFVPDADKVDVSTLPASHQNGYIGFVIGGKFATKCLPVEKIISICTGLDKPVLLLGGPDDKKVGEEVSNEIGEMVHNTCGQFNINQSASLVEQADKIITHDTGLMHIAAAFKKDVISIWGNTIPEFGMFPYLPGDGSQIVEVEGLKCRPCSKLGYAKCPKGHFDCMMKIDESVIVRSTIDG